MKKYGCIRDLQGGEFAVGCIGTAKEWGKIAYNWAENDNWENPKECLLENFKTEQELINFIQEIWNIEIIEIDTKEKELVCQCKENIRFDITEAGKKWEEIYDKYGNDFKHLTEIMEMFTDDEVYRVTSYLKEKCYKKMGVL